MFALEILDCIPVKNQRVAESADGWKVPMRDMVMYGRYRDTKDS
jgi:hypothetical protein